MAPKIGPKSFKAFKKHTPDWDSNPGHIGEKHALSPIVSIIH